MRPVGRVFDTAALHDQWINKSLPSLPNGCNLKRHFQHRWKIALLDSLIPYKSLNVRGEACIGGKKSQEIWTVSLCCIAKGTEKFARLVTGNSVKSKCFKNISTLPCKYTNNSKTPIMENTFLNFLCQFDARMGSSNRKLLLFEDKNPAIYKTQIFLKTKLLLCLPVNLTSRLQTRDLGVIHRPKTEYRKLLAQKAIASIATKSKLKLNVTQTMHTIVASWNAVVSATIVNCFRKAGFIAAHMPQKIMRMTSKKMTGGNCLLQYISPFYHL
jgi:hypothetical protein